MIKLQAAVIRTDEWKMSHSWVMVPAQRECDLCPGHQVGSKDGPQAEEPFWWEARLWTVGGHVGHLGGRCLRALSGSRGFRLPGGPWAALGRDCGVAELPLIRPQGLKAKRNGVTFGAYLNYLRQPGKTSHTREVLSHARPCCWKPDEAAGSCLLHYKGSPRRLLAHQLSLLFPPCKLG